MDLQKDPARLLQRAAGAVPTDKERGPDGQFGPEWGLVEERDEENFYFRLTQDPRTGLPGCDPKQWLLEFIDARTAAGKPFIVPDFRVAELRNAVEKLDGDLCISRPASRLKWGIPFPETFGAGFVTYVWFDALVNYITFVPGHDPDFGEREQRPGGQEKTPGTLSFADWWPPLHVIGKDILIPAHGVYWPVMLKALGFADDEMPTLLVHGWWNISGAKMSKSLGNVIDPDALADKYGAEAVRYYLMSDIVTGRDSDFSEERLVILFNTELANNAGNLLNRILSMAQKYRSGTIQVGFADAEFGSREQVVGEVSGAQLQLGGKGGGFVSLKTIRDSVGALSGNYSDAMDAHCPSAGLFHVSDILDSGNLLVEVAAPWKLAKDPTNADGLDAVLYHLAESLRIIAILLSPVLPRAAHGIFDQLLWKMDEQGEESRFRLADATWGGLPDGHTLGQPTPLFPRIETPAA